MQHSMEAPLSCSAVVACGGDNGLHNGVSQNASPAGRLGGTPGCRLSKQCSQSELDGWSNEDPCISARVERGRPASRLQKEPTPSKLELCKA